MTQHEWMSAVQKVFDALEFYLILVFVSTDDSVCYIEFLRF